jgi:hypothetical protein
MFLGMVLGLSDKDAQNKYGGYHMVSVTVLV